MLVCVFLLGIASEGILGQSYPLVFPDEEFETILDQDYDDFAFEEDDFRTASADRNVHAILDNDASGVDVEDLVVRKDVDSHLGSSHNHDHGNSHNHEHHGSIQNPEFNHGSASDYGDHGFPASSKFGYGYPSTSYGYDVTPTSGAYGYGGIRQPYYGLTSGFGYHPTSLGYPRVSPSVYGGYGSPTPFRRYGSRHGSRLARAGYGSNALYGRRGSRFGHGYGSPYGSRFAHSYGSPYGGYGSRFARGSPYVSGSYEYGSPYARFGSSSKRRGYGKLH